MTTFKSQNYLLRLATGFGVCMSAFLLSPEPVEANVCSLDNPSSINANGCYKTPDRYVVKILEMDYVLLTLYLEMISMVLLVQQLIQILMV